MTNSPPLRKRVKGYYEVIHKASRLLGLLHEQPFWKQRLTKVDELTAAMIELERAVDGVL